MTESKISLEHVTKGVTSVIEQAFAIYIEIERADLHTAIDPNTGQVTIALTLTPRKPKDAKE